MSCSQTDNIGRYYDGELSPTERNAVEEHLRQCAECRRTLGELTSLSGLLRQATRVPAQPSALERWYSLGRANERAVLRITGWLTSAAAAVLLAVLLTWPSNDGLVATNATVEMSLLTSQDLFEEPGSDTALAEWMANDLTAGEPYAQ